MKNCGSLLGHFRRSFFTCLLLCVMWLKSSSASIHRYNSVAPRGWTSTFLPELRELPPLSGKSALHLFLPSPWHWALFNGHCVSRWLAPGGQGVALHGHSWLTNVRSGTGRGPCGPNNTHPLGRVSCHLSFLVRGGWRLAGVCEGGVVTDWLGCVMGGGVLAAAAFNHCRGIPGLTGELSHNRRSVYRNTHFPSHVIHSHNGV